MAVVESVDHAYHGTTDGIAADAVTLTGKWRRFKIINRGTTPIYFTISIYGVTQAAPTVAGNDCYVVQPQGDYAEEFNFAQNIQNVEVQLISSAAVAYSVEGLGG